MIVGGAAGVDRGQGVHHRRKAVPAAGAENARARWLEKPCNSMPSSRTSPT